MMDNYYRVRNYPLKNECEIETEDRYGWGLGAHYLSDEEILAFGRGPFRPELVPFEWIETSKCIKPDFVNIDPGILTLKLEVFTDVFSTLFEGYVKTYDVYISGERYVSIRPDFFLDIFDREKSTYRLSSSGTLISPKRLLLKSAPHTELPIFGILFNEIKKPFIVVGDEFKRLYDAKGFTGLKFQLAWPQVEKIDPIL